MNKHLDAILLIIFSFLFTQYKTDVTTISEVIIPLIILVNFLYLTASYLGIKYSCIKKNCFKIKLILLFLIFAISIGRSTIAAIRMRHRQPNEYPVHDNPRQIEQAARYLYQGRNPYSEKYKGIGMEKSWPQNPAVYHVVTMPFYLIFSALVLYPINVAIGYFDERLVHWLVFIPAIYLLWKLLKKQKQENVLLFLIVFFFNPFFVHFLISGRSDVFVYSFLLFSFYFLSKKKYFFSSLFFGFAFVTKQSSWLLTPFFFYYLYLESEKKNLINKLKDVFRKTRLFFAVLLIFIVPFLIWDLKGFIDGIYNFPTGTLKTSFPIMGYGLSGFLREMHWIKQDAYFPFWIFQFIFGLPLLYFLLKYLRNNCHVTAVIRTYSLFLFIFWFFSRFFLDNYIGYLIMLFLTAEIFREKSRLTNETD